MKATLITLAVGIGFGWITHGVWVDASRADRADQATRQAQQAVQDYAAQAHQAAGLRVRDSIEREERRRADEQAHAAAVAAIESGAVRLSVRADCPTVSAPGTTGGNAGRAAPTAAELATAARPDYHALTRAILEVGARYEQCVTRLGRYED